MCVSRNTWFKIFSVKINYLVFFVELILLWWKFLVTLNKQHNFIFYCRVIFISIMKNYKIFYRSTELWKLKLSNTFKILVYSCKRYLIYDRIFEIIYFKKRCKFCDNGSIFIWSLAQTNTQADRHINFKLLHCNTINNSITMKAKIF